MRTIDANGKAYWHGHPISGGSGSTWLTSKLGSNASTSSTTFAAIGPSLTVASGKTYYFDLLLMVVNDDPGNGMVWDFNGGTAAATLFRAVGRSEDESSAGDFRFTALADNAGQNPMDGTNHASVRISGVFAPSGNGTFKPRFKQDSSISGNTTVLAGSYLIALEV